MNLNKHKKLFNAMYKTLHKLEHASKERLYVHTNISGYMYLLSTSGMIIEQAPDVTTLHARMMDILITYENQTKQKGIEMLSEQTAQELGEIEAEIGDLQQRLDAIIYQANRHATTNEELTTVDDLTAASRQLTAAIENIEKYAIHFE